MLCFVPLHCHLKGLIMLYMTKCCAEFGGGYREEGGGWEGEWEGGEGE